MPVSFERDIRPLFRQIDIDHMNKHNVLLDNYTYMSDPSNDHGNAQDVEDSLTNPSMPPGGPYWSNEQLVLYSCGEATDICLRSIIGSCSINA
jgi:hypothetical protein